jgi:glucosamine--fructose-6-phosphate aminotransferase (isomerizing)
MLSEAIESAQVVKRQSDEKGFATSAVEFVNQAPQLIITLARGSSDHAAHYFGYLCMLRLGIPVISLPLSLMSLHHAPLQVKGQWVFAFSQSGQSLDLMQSLAGLQRRGVHGVAWVNAPDSPLSKQADQTVLLGAGPEQSVAATKSFIAMLAASARWVALVSGDKDLIAGLTALPHALEKASQCDWTYLQNPLRSVNRVLVIGRGVGQSVALESALKLKETCGIQAEAFTSAEVRHGPMALIESGFCVLIYACRGVEQAGLLALAADLRQWGAEVILAAPDDVPDRQLTIVDSGHAWLDPLCAIQSFYVAVSRLAELRGLNPDVPRHLKKVTVTL